ncbi:MAG: hypothetical protein IPJ61_20125 [Tessaracoccus sp.]|uniref:hypothetical protein n=1 Tax=Tessaracoccus sp. TaxID=1971211 RepID=UPI001EC947CB|nr:hypothetical protein [Tessaracoccus sp.]MBK7823295.1 hypothetical protein [Tessaracoccus sp.]
MKEGDAFLLGVLAGALGVLVVAPYTTLFLLRHSRIVRDATRYRLENAVDQKIGKAVAEARRGQRPLARAAVNLAVPIIETASGQSFPAFVHNEVSTQGVIAAFAAFDIPNP